VGTSSSSFLYVAYIATTLCMLHNSRARGAPVTRVTTDVSGTSGIARGEPRGQQLNPRSTTWFGLIQTGGRGLTAGAHAARRSRTVPVPPGRSCRRGAARPHGRTPGGGAAREMPASRGVPPCLLLSGRPVSPVLPPVPRRPPSLAGQALGPAPVQLRAVAGLVRAQGRRTRGADRGAVGVVDLLRR
jgi:hypothetical protein